MPVFGWPKLLTDGQVTAIVNGGPSPSSAFSAREQSIGYETCLTYTFGAVSGSQDRHRGQLVVRLGKSSKEQRRKPITASHLKVGIVLAGQLYCLPDRTTEEYIKATRTVQAQEASRYPGASDVSRQDLHTVDILKTRMSITFYNMCKLGPDRWKYKRGISLL